MIEVEMAALRLKGFSIRKIAERLGVSKSQVQRTLRSWFESEPESKTQEPPASPSDDGTFRNIPEHSGTLESGKASVAVPEIPKPVFDSLESLLQPGPKATFREPVVMPPTPVVRGVVDEDRRPVDWLEESRTDLPVRSPGRIRYLLTVESPQQTEARIMNDKMRHIHRQGFSPFDIPQPPVIR